MSVTPEEFWAHINRDEKVYKIFDTASGVYWKSKGGRIVWQDPKIAKNNFSKTCRRLTKSGFANQSRFIIHEFNLELNRGLK